MQLSYDIGYNGIVKFNGYNLLATSGNISYTHQPIYSTGVWGAKDNNATNKYAVTPDTPQVNASIGFQLTDSIDLFKSLGKSMTTNRFSPQKIYIFPNGIAGYNSEMFVKSLSYETSQGGLVTASLSAIASGVPENCTVDANDGNVTDSFNSVFPYYSTCWKIYKTTSLIKTKQSNSLFDQKKVLSWSVQVSQQISFVKFCNLFKGQLDQLKADYAVFGLQNVSGRISIFGTMQSFSSSVTNPFGFISGNSQLSFYNAKGDKKMIISIANMLYTQNTLSLAGHSDTIETELNFQVSADSSLNYLINFGGHQNFDAQE